MLSRMGPSLKREVERQLLQDLAFYGVSASDLKIDWSHPCPEGHRTIALDGELWSCSNIGILDGDLFVARGWMDFIHGGGNNPFFVFWLFLDIRDGDKWKRVKVEPDIPNQVWDALSNQTKSLLTRMNVYDARWSQDPKVIEWCHGHED